MGKGIVKLGEGNWAVKDGNLLAAKETNGRFKNTEFTVSRGTRASYVGRDGLIKESNLQDVNLVNNGDFSELGSEIADDNTITNSNGGIITKTSDLNYNVISDGTAATQFLPRITFDGLTSGKTYKLIIIPSNQSGDIDLKLYNGSSFLFQDNDMSSELVYYFTSGVNNSFIAWAGQQTFNVDFTISLKEVDPNDYWTLGSGWSIEDGVATSNASANSYLNQSVYTIGNTYKLTFEVLEGTIELRSAHYSSGVGYYATGTHTVYVIPTTAETSFYVYTGFGQTSIDNVSVKEIKTDTPRIDFTDNTDGHLLLEPQRTNYVEYSNDASQWTDVVSNGTITSTSNYALAPNGENEATRLQLNSTTGYALKSEATTSFNDDYYISIYLKSNTTENQEVTIYGRNSLAISYTVTTQWQRFEVFCNNSSGSAFFNFGCRPSQGSDADLDILAWGGQLEKGTYTTSYIPTNGSTVTRDAETCTGAGSSADFNSEEGVLYAEISALANDGTFRMFGISDGTEDNSINLYYRSSFDQITARLKSGGSQEIFENFNITATNFSKVAFRYKSGESNLFIDGIKQKASDYTTTNMPSGLSELAFDGGGNTNFFYGKCKAIRVYKEALGDTDLQNLTS